MNEDIKREWRLLCASFDTQGDEMGWAWHSKRKTLPAHKQDCSAGLENGVKAVS